MNDEKPNPCEQKLWAILTPGNGETQAVPSREIGAQAVSVCNKSILMAMARVTKRMSPKQRAGLPPIENELPRVVELQGSPGGHARSLQAWDLDEWVKPASSRSRLARKG